MIIGLSVGCFDLLHEGHLHFLQEARSKCEYLIVGVNSDASVQRLKGKERPIQRVEQRMYAIMDRASAWVESVIPFDGGKRMLVRAIEPRVFLAGYDFNASPAFLHTLSETKCTLLRISHLPGYSTSLQLANAQAKTSA